MLTSGWLTSQSVSAGVIDFGDGDFTPISNSGTGDAVSFSETSNGVTLTFTATDNLVGGDRFIGMQVGNVINGLHLGGGGGSTLEFTVSSDSLVTLDSYTTSAGGFFLGGAGFNVAGPGVNSVGNLIGANDINSAFASGPLLLQPNQDYTFTVTPVGSAVQSYVSSFTVSAVPEPSSACVLMLVGIGGWLYRRRDQTTDIV